MLSSPIYIDKNNTVMLILENKIASHEKTIPDDVMKRIEDMWKTLNKTQKKIIKFLFENHKGTVEEISQAIIISKKIVQRYLIF